MNNEFLNNWNKVTKDVQQPLQSLMELNLQTLHHLYPYPWKYLNKPQTFEKQMSLIIEHGKNNIDYIQKTFDIFEKTFTSLNKVPTTDLTESLLNTPLFSDLTSTKRQSVNKAKTVANSSQLEAKQQAAVSKARKKSVKK